MRRTNLSPDGWAPLTGPRVHPEGEPLAVEGSFWRGLRNGVLGTVVCAALVYALVVAAAGYPLVTFGGMALVFGAIWRRARRYDKEHGLG